ncbi:DinB family protein [Amycolatopsis sp. WQ 127309]|uniref:DinB family protein n=1 Tax=Amycolatopsis sp. WQ 127309 TaxID=2932773 RepID=UPI001FF4DF83|nr:DinB family protein [Amycolatopsis sp. WQ 127309]UOZ09746.1 DinB family protein [Amycolatopsis sp. WQ 127309]
MTVDWTTQLADQLDFHWQNFFRPKLDGLTDDEYLWEPVPGCWTVRPRKSDDEPGSGEFTIDFAHPAPEPPPVTTIAWRLSHILVGVLGMRTASHFGGPAMDYDSYDYPGTAAGALGQLDELYGRWIAGVRALDAAGLARPCGPAEGPYAAEPLATLVLHINRETLHHGAEVLLLRDLYRRR